MRGSRGPLAIRSHAERPGEHSVVSMDVRGNRDWPLGVAQRGAMIAYMSLGPERVALVTGSSRGLGAAIARRLGRDGLAVAVNSLHGDAQAFEVARTIRDDGGISDAFPADVTDERQVAALVTAVTDRLGPIDVLVLNATGRYWRGCRPDGSVASCTWTPRSSTGRLRAGPPMSPPRPHKWG
jgi:hypothetical protein